MVSARSAVLYCVNNDMVLFDHNDQEKLAMASTTKIMTALLTLEAAAKEDRLITVTAEAAAVEGSSMELEAGDQLRLSDLAAGMLTVSGNDAAAMAAIALDGSEAAFADRMNQRAAELGMTNTHFVTASGLDDPQHYSTALDMAKLGAAAIGNPAFRTLCSAPSVQIELQRPKKKVTLRNHNRLLRQYADCIGVKTGFTKKAGRCLVTAAERNGVLLVAVTLNDPNDWEDHTRLLDYGFRCVQPIPELPETWTIPVVGGATDAVSVSMPEQNLPLVCDRDRAVTTRVFLPKFLYAPVTADVPVGRVRLEADGVLLQELPLLTAAPVEAQPHQPTTGEKLQRCLEALFA